MSGSEANTPPTAVTVSHVLGEITWLISQSARHQDVRVCDLGWLAMPPIRLRQFHIFREGERPVGVALWAFPPTDAAKRLAEAPVSRENQLGPDDWCGSDQLWLVDLIAPFSNAQNRQIEVMFGDLITGPFKNREFRMLGLNARDNTRSEVIIEPTAGAKLVERVAAALSSIAR